MSTKRHALVTGGAGFIGSWLCEELLGRGWGVTALDDLSSGAVEHLDGCLKKRGFQFYAEKLSAGTFLYKLCEQADVVFHLAAMLGVGGVIGAPARVAEGNLEATRALFTSLTPDTPVVFTSTSEVYGTSFAPVLDEGHPAVVHDISKARWAYAAAKIMDESLFWAHHHERGLRFIIARLFNAAGPRQNAALGMVLPSFVHAALHGKPLLIYGDGAQSRCFTWVGDTVKALADLAEHGPWNTTYNVGCNQPTTIRKLARTVLDVTGSKSAIEYRPYSDLGEDFQDMPRRVPDLARLKAALGWVPETPLRTIVEATVEAMR